MTKQKLKTFEAQTDDNTIKIQIDKTLSSEKILVELLDKC